MIETLDLTKRFPGRQGWRALLRPRPDGGVLAVDRVSLAVHRGEIFGLLGPNGAGKTTLARMLCTLILPNAGHAQIAGYDLQQEVAVKAQVGLATGEERSFYWRLNGRQNLRFYGILQGLSHERIEQRISELDRDLELGVSLERRYDRLSTGMRRRLDLARALLHCPPILFLDEPTRSLDPEAAARLHDLIRSVARSGHTIFLVTHHLYEAETLCDRVAIMHRGRLRAVAPVAELQQLVQPYQRYRLSLAPPSPAEAAPWDDWPWPVEAQPTTGGPLLLRVDLPIGTPLDPVLQPLLAADYGITHLETEEPSLEEVFRQLTTDDSSTEEIPLLEAPAPKWTPASNGSGTARASAQSAASPGGPEGGPNALDDGRSQEPPTVAVQRTGWRATWRKLSAFLRRDLQVQLSYRFSTLLQLFGILLSVSTFYFVARIFGQGASPFLSPYGGDYFAFVLIGIAFAGYQAVGLHAFAGAIQSGQSQGTLEAMMVTPTRLETILLASALWSFLRSSFQVVLYLLGGALLFEIELGQANIFAALLTLLLSIFAFSGLGILSAGFVLVAKRGNPINFLFGGLSTLLSGVYYPVDVLPEWLQSLSNMLPMTHSLQAMRLSLLQGAGLVEVAPNLILLALFAAIVLPGSMWAFHHALRQARMEGSLTQF